MSDTFLPGSGFDTYESQDKVLVQMDGSRECAVAVRILQQQGFAVAGAAVRLFPQEAKTADAVCRSGLACKKRIPENPQIFRNSNIKIMFPLNMARVQRRPFETYG